MGVKVVNKSRGVMDAEKAMKYKEFLGHPLTQKEMRLIPYVQYCAVNHQTIDRRSVDKEETELLKEWDSKGWCECYPFNATVIPSRKFWDFMNDVLWDFYCLELVSTCGDE